MEVPFSQNRNYWEWTRKGSSFWGDVKFEMPVKLLSSKAKLSLQVGSSKAVLGPEVAIFKSLAYKEFSKPTKCMEANTSLRSKNSK